jgi:hypothetical protein
MRYGPSVAMTTAVGAMSISGFNQRVKEGQNPAFAAAMEGVNFAAQMMLPISAQIALYGIPATRAATQLVVGAVQKHNTFVRMSRTPFSHRFEHTDVTSRMQQMGLQSIGAAWGHANMGSEASMMARRYGR